MSPRPLALVLLAACTAPSTSGRMYDVIIRNGLIHDGSGGPAYRGDVAIDGDTIAVVGAVGPARGRVELDARGLAVAPGFINMLSWAVDSLMIDGRAQSDIRQGVTLEIFGEGWSMGPLTEDMKRRMKAEQVDLYYDIGWTTLGEYLAQLEQRGVSPNVASFVGATTVRLHELGHADRPPTPGELERMQGLVRHAMEEGALGVGASLIYPPASFARTDELVALARAAAAHGGIFVAHLRSEGVRFEEAVEELIHIAREADIAAEIYHLKAAGEASWPKLERVIARVEQARAEGVRVSANMYTYTAGATGLDAAMPPWVHEGGYEAATRRLEDPATRARVIAQMRSEGTDWENLLRAVGTPERVLLLSFKNEALKPLTGKTLAEVARARGTSAEDTVIDLVLEDGSRVGAAYFMMSEDNVRRAITLPWVSFGSDEAAPTAEGVFLRSRCHPRAYGNVARLLGRYVREEKLISLPEAVRRLTSLPARTLGLERRGALEPGAFADVVVFDPATVIDHATFDQPHRYATGVQHVFVNGVLVLEDGEHTGATPGRVIRGRGFTGAQRAAPARP